jgi:hypothetical protein
MNAFARFVALGSLPVVLLAAGCTSQGEGERCTVNTDCQADLFCFAVPNGGMNVSVCCPAMGVSSNPLCNGTFEAGVAQPPPGTDAGAETSTDASAEEAATDSSDGSTQDVSVEAATD